MNKRITSIVVCLAVLISLVVGAVPVSAGASVDFLMVADQTVVNVGDTITYTISIGEVEKLSGIVFTLVIPEGLTYVSDSASVNPDLKANLDFGEASFTESTKVFVGMSNYSSDVPADTVLMTFQCSVDEGATGTLTIVFDILDDDVFDENFDNIPFTVTTVSVQIAELSCEHDWAAADCENPKTCNICGATEGSALGHNWDFATCTEPETCSVCGATNGEPNGHSWDNATCTAPKTCVECGATEGAPAGHDWAAADCENPKTCNICGATEGSALGHKWDNADCTTPKTCSVCGATEGAAAGHDWAAADCDSPKTCNVCGVTEGEPNGHNWADADCQNPSTCTVCGATEGKKGDHVDNDDNGKCDVCGYEENPKSDDVSMMAFVVLLMLALTGSAVLICNKKKFIA